MTMMVEIVMTMMVEIVMMMLVVLIIEDVANIDGDVDASNNIDYVIACVEFGQNTDYAPAPLIVFSDVATIRNLNSSL